jgi:hypothetical protein
MMMLSTLPRCATLLLFLLHWRTGRGFVAVVPKSATGNLQINGASSSSSSFRSSSRLLASAVDPLVLQKVAKDVATGGALAFAGDVIAQSLTATKRENKQPIVMPKEEDWDKVRTAALTTFGALYTGGAQHFVFAFLNGHFTNPITRLLLAQFCFIPFCYYPTFLLMVPALRAVPYAFASLSGGPSSDKNTTFAMERARLTQEVLGRLPATLLRNWCFWLPVQYVQFSYIPTDLQVTYCAAFGVIWNAILSWSTMQTAQTVEENESKDKVQ